ncbi:MAG: hypothetical protein J6C96_03855 [Oscillospiraceae bacterium]|nr:hypothetical protein [Oscillospiraceae bacterium]
MVKTTIGGVDVQEYIEKYVCQCPPVNGNNGFFDINGEYIPDKKGDEVLISIRLIDVPTPVSEKLAEALSADTVEVDYTTPVPRHDVFYKVDYSAECEDADPDNTDFDETSEILWNIDFSLRSAGYTNLPGGL